MATQLTLYNEALRVLGETRLASIAETRPVRYTLDDVWNGGGVKACLEQGLWNFATRSVEIAQDSDLTPAFGMRYAFSKPTDYVRTAAVCSDPNFREPVLRYADERGYWFCDLDTLYISYISDASELGSDLTLWTPAFATFAAHYFAKQVAPTFVKDKKRLALIFDQEKKALNMARNSDAMNEPTQIPSPSNWTRSRYTSGGSWDRGSHTNLIG